jgi:hypothetical protein
MIVWDTGGSLDIDIEGRACGGGHSYLDECVAHYWTLMVQSPHVSIVALLAFWIASLRSCFSVRGAVDRPRVHHQLLPEHISGEGDVPRSVCGAFACQFETFACQFAPICSELQCEAFAASDR